MKILSWNCQGAASRVFRRAFLHLCKDVRPYIVGLLEPRTSGAAADKVCRSFGFDNWVRIEAMGFCGGIWVLWDNNLDMEVITTNPQFILCKVRKGVGEEAYISFVYGIPKHNLRRKLWEGLSYDDWNMQGTWITVGDYNVVLSIEEVSNKENFGSRRCVGMRDWIFREGLIDLGFVGVKVYLDERH